MKPVHADSKVRNFGPPFVDPTRAELAATLGMSNLRNFTVNVEDGRATVDLDSIVVDHRPGTTFVWRLQVIDTDKNPSIDVCYDQQIFQVEADGAIEPNFHEVVELPSGAARISVMLYTIHPKFTLETLKQLDPEVRNTHRLFRGTEPN